MSLIVVESVHTHSALACDFWAGSERMLVADRALFDIFMKLKYLDAAALTKRMMKARSSFR